MGFLKFLKREKKEESLDELDLPPEPPPLDGFDDNAHDFPEFPDISNEDSAAGGEMPDFDFDKEAKNAPSRPKQEEIPGFPEFPDISGENMPEFDDDKDMIPLIKAPAEAQQPAIPAMQPMVHDEEADEEPKAGEMQQITEQFQYPSKTESRLFAPRIQREMPAGKSIYIKIDRFKAALGSINVARSDLKKSEEALSKLENIKMSKDRSLEKIKSSLDDLQRKLIFVDKTLFKGE